MNPTVIKAEPKAGATNQYRQERIELEAQLSQRYGEIATLTRFLAEQSQEARRLKLQLEWLTPFVTSFRSGKRGWKARFLRLMPLEWHYRRMIRRLEARKLFDPDAYLRVNPDVAASGFDPFCHYLLHGIDEGRPLGISNF